MKKIVAIIQARVGSTRLPGKVLFNLSGKTVLEQVINRVMKSKLIHEVVVATTSKKEDLKIVDICDLDNIKCYCGSENDVLDRYYQAAKMFDATDIVRITADCPLIDPAIIDKAISLHLNTDADYSTNTFNETFPDGLDVEVFKFSVLKKTWESAKLYSEREHVTSYIKKNPKLFKFSSFDSPVNLSGERWTLDNQADYEAIRIIYDNLYGKDQDFGTDKILEFLENHPEVGLINRHIARNEGYKKSLEKDYIV